MKHFDAIHTWLVERSDFWTKWHYHVVPSPPLSVGFYIYRQGRCFSIYIHSNQIITCWSGEPNTWEVKSASDHDLLGWLKQQIKLWHDAAEWVRKNIR